MREGKNTIAVVMICRNEEEFIERCLNSVKDIADEICIYDTGSTDKTIEIIKTKFPFVKLQLGVWKKDFSWARNQSIAMVSDDIDFLMQLDSDEVLASNSSPILREMINQDQFPILLCNIFNEMNDGSVASLFYPRIWRRFWRGRDLGIHYENPVHNQLIYSADLPVIRTNIDLIHYGYALEYSKMRKKHARSLELLLNQIEEDKDNFFAHLNLAQLARAMGNIDLTMKHALEVLRICREDDPKFQHAILMALDQYSTMALRKEMFSKAEEYSLKALKLKPNYLDPMINLGLLYLRIQNHERATFWLTKYLKTVETYDVYKDSANLILSHLRSQFIAYYGLAEIEYKQKRYDLCIKYLHEVYKMSPKYQSVTLMMGDIFNLQLNKPEEADFWYKRSYDLFPEKRGEIHGKFADKSIMEGNYDLAKIHFKYAFNFNGDSNNFNRLNIIRNVFGKEANVQFQVNN